MLLREYQSPQSSNSGLRMRRIHFVIGATLILVVGCGLGRLKCVKVKAHIPSAIQNQAADLKMIADAIDASCIEQKANLLRRITNRVSVTSSNIYLMLSQSSVATMKNWSNKFLRTENRMTDLWGSELNFEALRTTNTIVVFVWSNGANKINDRKRGDDIVCQWQLICPPD